LLSDPASRRIAIGSAVAVTAATIVYSRWGRRSGAHCNPAVTLTFFRFGKVARGDLYGYVAAQFIGGLTGAAIVAVCCRGALAHPAVRWFVAIPGMSGSAAAFGGEFGVTAILMTAVLLTMRSQRLRACTGVCAAAILALAISFESPLSGTGLNPARTVATSAISGIWEGWWIYFLAPAAGMLLAAQAFGRGSIPCAKLAHDTGRPCHFLNCTLSAAPPGPPANPLHPPAQNCAGASAPGTPA
jgi:aquaporin Z